MVEPPTGYEPADAPLSDGVTESSENLYDGNNSDLPESPTEALQFGIYTDTTVEPTNSTIGDEPTDDEREVADTDGFADFNPLYFPERVTVTTEKELSRVGAGCEGEEVYIKKLKNSDVSITGKMHSEDLSNLQDIAEFEDKVEVLCPLLRGSGMDMIIKSTEYGEILGWDAFPTAQDWLIQYQIDLVSTGEQEYEAGGDGAPNFNRVNEEDPVGSVGGSSSIREGL